MYKTWFVLVAVGSVLLYSGCATSSHAVDSSATTLMLLDEQIDISYDFIPRRPMTSVEVLHFRELVDSTKLLASVMARPGCADCEKVLRERRQKLIESTSEANRLYSDMPSDLLSDIESALQEINESIGVIRNERPQKQNRKRIVRFFVRKMPSRYTFAWPLEEFHISCPFGWRRHPITGKRQFHDGIDLAAPRGRIVFATAPGRVVFAGYKRRAGNVVVIEHPGGYRSFYAHLDEILVPPGITVSQGNPIGTVGTTGWTTGAHLHFKITKGFRVLDPMKVIGKEVIVK